MIRLSQVNVNLAPGDFVARWEIVYPVTFGYGSNGRQYRALIGDSTFDLARVMYARRRTTGKTNRAQGAP